MSNKCLIASLIVFNKVIHLSAFFCDMFNCYYQIHMVLSLVIKKRFIKFYLKFLIAYNVWQSH